MKRSSVSIECRIWLLPALLCLSLLAGCRMPGKSAPEPAPTPEPTPEPIVNVSLGGWDYLPTTRAIFLASDDVTEAELRAALSELPALRKLEYPKCSFDVDTQLKLTADFPQVRFTWPVHWAGQTNSNDVKTLDLRTKTPDLAELQRVLPLFSALEMVDLGTTLLTNEQAQSLGEAFPGTEFLHVAELYDMQFPSTAEEIDLSHIEMSDTETVEAALVHFPHLKKVCMHFCGLDNETMDALNRRYEDIRFVWTVSVLGRAVPTDSLYFIQYKFDYSPIRSTTLAMDLRYCTDMIALDLGHTGLSNDDLAFLPCLDKLQYLILGETHFKDLSMLTGMKDLLYLEIWQTPVSDLSPLLELPKLYDLNLSNCYEINGDGVKILSQMTQLERLWFYSLYDMASIQEALPNCLIKFDSRFNVGLAWRDNARYFTMRDIMESPYMW